MIVALVGVATGVAAKPTPHVKPSASSGPAASSAPSSSAPAPSSAPVASIAASTAPSASGAGAAAGSVTGCVEVFPEGLRRPDLVEQFPVHGKSGYAAVLTVVIDHGKGESVLPQGLELQSRSESAKQLKAAGFLIPDQGGGAVAKLTSEPPDPAHPDRLKTTLELPLLTLPPKPGRQTLVLPPFPIALSRANGEIETACTHPHTIVIEDPTASTPDPKPQPNPPPREQREEWTAMRKVVTYGSIGVLAGLILAYLIYKWNTRPKPVVPPPPPRPPWEVALERLDEVRHAGLLEVARFQEYFDRVNDAVREYLGARYGFDGLESTTDEILKALKHASIDELALPAVLGFCEECDLVKFANVTPSLDSCQRVLDAAERIVRTTMPRVRPQFTGDGPFPPRGGRPDDRDTERRGP